MNKRYINFLFTFLFPIISLGQSKTLDCSSIRNGTFYFCPLNPQKKFTIIRENSIQKEIDIKTFDTSFWRVSWQSDCVFNLKFIRRSRLISEKEKIFLNSHSTTIKILNITRSYYVFKADVDLGTTVSTLTDTLWFKPK